MKSVKGFFKINFIFWILSSVVLVTIALAKDYEFVVHYNEKVNMAPIEIVDFDSVISMDGIELHWLVYLPGTPTQVEVERSRNNIDYSLVDMVYGSVIDSQTVKFVYYEFNSPRGGYYYRLKSIPHPGIVRYSKPVFINAEPEIQPVLEQNTPNPFNPCTNIQFRLASPNKVSLRVYNILGQQINTLMDGFFESGLYTVQWSGRDDTGRDVTGGVYFYQILIGHYAETRRMILVR